MKKINLFMVAVAATGLAACSDTILTDNSGIVESASNAITFENVMANNSTRTSVMGAKFIQGAQMEIYGFQTTAGVVDKIFDDQLVTYDGGSSWSYTPVKYWNSLSSYKFYGAYPAGNYVFDEPTKKYAISGFTVAPAIADQVDLMIAEENSTTPGNTVTMNFNHLLSQVNFYAKIHENMQKFVNGENKGVVSGYITGISITGLKNSGNFTQTGFDANTFNVTGNWTSGGSYVFPTIPSAPVGYTYVKCGTMSVDDGNVVRDLLMVPQSLSATLTVNYSLTYADGTTSSFQKSIPLESIKFNNKPLTSWNMNTIYNYVMTLDPTRAVQQDFTGIAVDWDGTTNGDCTETPGSKLVGPDANGEYTIEYDDDNDPNTPAVVYPVVWEDVDGDGKPEAGVDRDGDGHIDNVDGDTTNNSDPANSQVSDNGINGKDVILVDTDGDGLPDTQLEKVITSIVGPEDPTRYSIDYDGSLNGEAVPTPGAKLVQDTNGDYLVVVDADGDGVNESEYRVLWADLDGDGKEEGYITNVDQDNINNLDQNSPIWQQITDGKTQNPNGYDVILVDTDNNGSCETQLERSKKVVVTPDPLITNAIEFSAQVEYWDTTTEGDLDVSK